LLSENPPQKTSLSGRIAYEQALDEMLEDARNSVRIFDASLSAAYNSLRRTEAIRRFLLQSRLSRLQIVVHDASVADRNCPRLIGLLRQFHHAISIYCTQPQAKGVYDPFALIDARHSLRRFHFDDLRGEVVRDDPGEAHTLDQRFSDLWSNSEPAISATTLGL
jgi:hypothetical protein